MAVPRCLTQIHPHAARLGGVEKSTPHLRMCGPKAFRNQNLDRLPQQFVLLELEHAVGFCVGQDDAAPTVDHHHGRGGGFDRRTKSLLGLGTFHGFRLQTTNCLCQFFSSTLNLLL